MVKIVKPMGRKLLLLLHLPQFHRSVLALLVLLRRRRRRGTGEMCSDKEARRETIIWIMLLHRRRIHSIQIHTCRIKSMVEGMGHLLRFRSPCTVG